MRCKRRNDNSLKRAQYDDDAINLSRLIDLTNKKVDIRKI